MRRIELRTIARLSVYDHLSEGFGDLVCSQFGDTGLHHFSGVRRAGDIVSSG
jgi:hypothetical protein